VSIVLLLAAYFQIVVAMKKNLHPN
jgi:hypothetical protein